MKKNNVHMFEQKEEAIMTQNRHQLIYSKNGEERGKFLAQLMSDYPVKFNNYSPIAVCVDDALLPVVEQINPNINEDLLNLVSMEYLNLSIAHSISEVVFSVTDNILDTEALDTFLLKVNSSWASKSYLSGDSSDISLSQLTLALKKSKAYYLKFYLEYMKGEAEKIDASKLPFVRIDPIEYAEVTKNLINNKAYFCTIINYNGDGCETSKEAVNDIISKRCNATLSVKLFTDINDWDSMYCLNKSSIEFSRDYGEVDLDGSKKAYSKTRDRRWFL